MRRRYRPILMQSGNPTLENITRRSPGRRHFRQLSGSRGIPPIPLIGTVYRNYFAEPVTDTLGISNTNWTSGQTGVITELGVSATSNCNSIYHYYTVPNARNSNYEVIMQPLRLSVAAPTTDGGYYDFFYAGNPASSTIRYPHGSIFEEVCPYPLPSDSHATFNGGWTEITYPSDVVSPRQQYLATSSFGIANYDAFNPTYAIVDTQIILHAIQKRKNGSAYGSVILIGTQNSGGGRDWQMDVAKGDTVELDVWLKLKSIPRMNVASGVPGRGVAYRLQSVVSTGRQNCRSANVSLLLGQTGGTGAIRFKNINFSPSHNFKEQTYRITISGHTGYTLKDGSDGPHKMYSNHGWTMAQSNGLLEWSNPQSTSFKNILLTWTDEIPYITLRNPGTDYVAAGGTASDRWFYRPTFGASTSYRASTTIRQVLFANGTTNAAAGVVEHAPSGVFDQDGTTTFDLVQWQDGLESGYAGWGQRPTAHTSPVVGTVGDWVPTTITLTQVDL